MKPNMIRYFVIYCINFCHLSIWLITSCCIQSYQNIFQYIPSSAVQKDATCIKAVFYVHMLWYECGNSRSETINWMALLYAGGMFH